MMQLLLIFTDDISIILLHTIYKIATEGYYVLLERGRMVSITIIIHAAEKNLFVFVAIERNRLC